MTEAVVQDWLSEWASLDPGQVHSYTAVLDHNEELLLALQTVIEERSRFPTLLDSVCDQLFTFYRSRELPLQRFTLELLPTLMYVYLAAVASGDKKSFKSVETLLLGMYNLEVVTETGEPLVLSFRLPSLAQGSIYHEPTREAITESALRRYEEVNTKPVTWGPHSQVEALNAQNRLRVLTALLFVFNRHIGTFHRSSLKNLCRVSSRIVMQGFPRPGHHQRASVSGETNYLPKLPPRIPVNAQFLLELSSGLYYAMYNDFGYVAMEAIKDIHNRGCFECFSDVILITNAMKNSSHVSATGQPSEGPMGISVALSPATNTVTTVSKSMITNASFRTKKLPDDLDPLDSCTLGSIPMGLDEVAQVAVNRRRGQRRRGWKWLQPTPEEEAENNTEFEEVLAVRLRRRSDVVSIPKQFNEENFRSLGSDSPKRRVFASARQQNGVVNTSNRGSAGARLINTLDEDEANDIPIISAEDGKATSDGNQLVSIMEEKEEEPSNFTPRGASLRGKDAVTKNLQKLGIGKKPKPKTSTPVADKSGTGDKKGKSVKSPVIQNGDVTDGSDSPQVVKRRSAIENGDGVGMNGALENPPPSTPDVMEIIDSHSINEPIRRLDMSPGAHKKLLDLNEEPIMQVSSV